MSDGARRGAVRPSTADSLRGPLLRHALRLSWASIGFGLIAGSVSVGSGIAEHSLGVLAAGLSVLADVTGSVVLVWRFRTERSDPARAQQVEELAARAVAGALGAIAVALSFESISALVAGSHPGSSALTVSTAAVSIVVLAPLAHFKRRTALRLASHALRGDSTLSAIGALTAVLALVGLVLYDALGWWWADRVVALVIALVAVVEARTLLTAEHAGD
ncbi:MAG TPA: cation transporter [Solirubrobacteraceae bacterium]|nr:cation transporter [Solirubrobacteraceae bacterium]